MSESAHPRERAAPSHWRPSGPARRPKTPESRPSERNFAKEPPPGYLPGGFAEQRAAARREASRDVMSSELFGPQGMLAQLREGEAREARDAARDAASMMPVGLRPAGAPQNGNKRLEDRRAAKEAKVEQMLEERAIRLAAEQAEREQKRSLARKAASANLARSAPELPQMHVHQLQDAVKRKMHLLDYLAGAYGGNAAAKAVGGAAGLLNAEQAKVLAHLQGHEESAAVDDGQSVQQRLRLVSEACDMAFMEAEL